MRSPAKPYIVRSSAEGVNPSAVAAITQDQLVDVLTLEEEIRMIRLEIRIKKLRIAGALLRDAVVESGRHAVYFDKKKKLQVKAFRGAILRYSGEQAS